MKCVTLVGVYSSDVEQKINIVDFLFFRNMTKWTGGNKANIGVAK